MESPLGGFSIYKLVEFKVNLFNIGLAITNNSFYLILSFILLSLILVSVNSTLGKNIIPTNLGLVGEALKTSLLTMSRQTGGNQVMLPFLLGLFGIILMANLLSNITYNYASTSALTFTLGLSVTIFIGVTVLAVSIKGWSYLATFVPSGTPNILLPVLVLIELVSYSARAISLGVRLFANILSGHTLLTIISTMSNKIMMNFWFGIFVVIIPLILLTALVGLEIAVAFIQAYVFTILTAIYINEAIKPLV
jgi:F-type H+-transporting ATPase subunit a